MFDTLALAGLALYLPISAHTEAPSSIPLAAHVAHLAHLAHVAGDDAVIKALKHWVRVYRGGKWDFSDQSFRAQLSIYKKSMALRYELIEPDSRGRMSYLGEIRLLCRHAQRIDDAEAAAAVLTIAAVGLDRRVRYLGSMAPNLVRSVGEHCLARFQSDEAIAYLIEAAGGTPGGHEKFVSAKQAAALRVLGAMKKTDQRELMIDQLTCVHAKVRTAAACALGTLGETAAVKPLALRLAQEGDDATIIEILDAIDRIRGDKSEGSVEVDDMRMAVIEAGKVLGRSESWRVDLAAVDFLEKYRFKHSVPRLIGMLERYVSQPRSVASGRLCGRLRVRLREALTAITGAHIPMTAPAKWAEFWQGAKAGFELSKVVDARHAPAGGTESRFFNIPIQGKRVVFVIDVSGSMARGMKAAATGKNARPGNKGRGRESKLRVAKRELLRAVTGLPDDAMFKVVFYNEEVKVWRKKLLPATDANKAKFSKWLKGLRAVGATNIYDALKLAMTIRSLVYGDHYDSNVDEVFFLSDGSPTVGEVQGGANIVKIITETNKFSRVRINTVYLDGDMRPGIPGMRRRGRGGNRNRNEMSGAELMKQLAEKNNGAFVKL